MDTNHIKSKAVIVVKRRWHQPEILAYVNKNEVGAQMQIADFLRALADEVYGDRNRFFMLSKAEFLEKALDSADEIQNAMKETTAHVV